MFKFNLKIFFFIKIIFIYLILCLNSFSEDFDVYNSNAIIGSNDATVKIKVFSSLTCPHCAEFHKKIVPEIVKNYVKAGLVQLIFIDFPLDQAAFNAAKLLNCIKKEKKIIFLDTIYEDQDKWTAGSTIDDINKNLKKIVKDLGITSDQFDACLIDEVISDKILNDRIKAAQKYSINSTPTIIINEKKFEDSVNFKNIKKKIEKII